MGPHSPLYPLPAHQSQPRSFFHPLSSSLLATRPISAVGDSLLSLLLSSEGCVHTPIQSVQSVEYILWNAIMDDYSSDIRRTWKSSTKHHKIKLGYKVCHPAQPRSSSGYWYPSILRLVQFNTCELSILLWSQYQCCLLYIIYHHDTLLHPTEYFNLYILHFVSVPVPLHMDIYQPRGSSWSSPYPVYS